MTKWWVKDWKDNERRLGNETVSRGAEGTKTRMDWVSSTQEINNTKRRAQFSTSHRSAVQSLRGIMGKCAQRMRQPSSSQCDLYNAALLSLHDIFMSDSICSVWNRNQINNINNILKLGGWVARHVLSQSRCWRSALSLQASSDTSSLFISFLMMVEPLQSLCDSSWGPHIFWSGGCSGTSGEQTAGVLRPHFWWIHLGILCILMLLMIYRIWIFDNSKECQGKRMTFSKGHKLDSNPRPKRSAALFYYRSIRGCVTGREALLMFHCWVYLVMVKYAAQLLLSSSLGFLLPLVSLKPKWGPSVLRSGVCIPLNGVIMDANIYLLGKKGKRYLKWMPVELWLQRVWGY